uniref:CSON014827 protein n=1 Tax=Culicoides sonorensis TaxID=179676 RepID=A0A336MPB2_CULSO
MEQGQTKKQFYRNYTNDTVDITIENIKNESLTVNAASKKYNVPRSTLRRRLVNPVQKKSGRDPVLTFEIEKELVDWAQYLDDIGAGVTKEDFFRKAADLSLINDKSQKAFKSELPTSGWLTTFMKRHPTVSFRKQSYLSRASAVVSEKDLRAYYQKIYDYLRSHDLLYLLDCPDRWLNGDETNFQLNAVPPRVLSRKGKKVVYRVEKAKPKESVTGMYTFSADGFMYKPLYILNDKVTNMPEIANACIEVGAKFGFAQTDNGWQTKTSFVNYVKDHLYPELLERGVQFPVIYFVDGHSSHSSFELFKWCRDHKIIFILSYPNSTHITQPCDTSIFGPLKRAWPIEMSNYEREHDTCVTLVDFVKILKRVHDRVMKPEAVINGFRMCGIFPLNADNVHFDRCIAVGAETSVVTPVIGEPSVSGIVIAVGSDQNLMDVETINTPIIDPLFTTTQNDWNTALQQPFLIESLEIQTPPVIENPSLINHEESNCLNILTTIKNNLEELRSALPQERPELFSSVSCMNQLCDFVLTNITHFPNSLESNSSLTQNKPMPSLPSLNELQVEKTVANILKRPAPPERSKAHRLYGKIPKFGVMSSEEVVQQYEEDRIEKENLKETKLKRQNDIKQLQQQIKIIRQTQKQEIATAREQKFNDANRLKTSRERKRKAEVLKDITNRNSNDFEPDISDAIEPDTFDDNYDINLF